MYFLKFCFHLAEDNLGFMHKVCVYWHKVFQLCTIRFGRVYLWNWDWGTSLLKYGEDSACNEGDPDLIPGSGRSTGERNDNPFQYSRLENSMDRGAWWPCLWGRKELDTTERLSITIYHRIMTMNYGKCWLLLKNTINREMQRRGGK